MIVRPLGLALGALAGAALVGVGAVTPASAETLAQGRVVAVGGVTARSLPTPLSQSFGVYDQGEQITLLCQVKGSTVDGNARWYRTPSEGSTWVSARWVENVGKAPGYCGSAARYPGRTTATLTEREAPTTRATARGTLPAGSTVTVICSWEGERVGGDAHWYHLTDGRWVAARYVDDVGKAPELCL